MSEAVATLLAILDLEPIEQNIFRGRSPQTGWQRVFGGVVISQALVAATRTVEADRHVHSLHAYFLRPGDPAIPILYEVERIRDGKSFATRRVMAIQHGQPIFALSASFQRQEEGFSHQPAMPAVPGPDEEDHCGTEALPKAQLDRWRREGTVELRPVGGLRAALDPGDGEPPMRHIWLKAVGTLPDERVIHEAVLAYASDMTLLDTALVPEGHSVLDATIQAASLDHALWFHAPFRADEWLLYSQESPFAGGARGFARGQVWRRDGTLVASVAQEGLVRLSR